MAHILSQQLSSATLEQCQVSIDRGFLPSPDPPDRLPTAVTPWEEIAHDRPKLLVAGKLRSTLEPLPILDTAQLKTNAQYQRAMLLLSYFGHGYVWGRSELCKPSPHRSSHPVVPGCSAIGSPVCALLCVVRTA